ncbi:hydroxymethylglutaryl- lyase [Moniliophthora roreri MCA 2997]|uniref:hydroxymethylglutaryl-CoA lyase n=1 Tax=Moniliophthora roreri (strain MCA 2997) TaxID=1381753 RepID=V2YM62_MONRO|nr:hydroxymethylglutaryl- lyase [Moniliophthora roreri MCA 2997]
MLSQAPRCLVRSLRSTSSRIPQVTSKLQRRGYASEAKGSLVNIVEVGPRDGLQNEKGVIPVSVKIELINRLALAGCQNIEAGSFVSPRWVPQMAGTAEVITEMERLPGVHYAVLVPNQKGLDSLTSILSVYNASPLAQTTLPPSDEISIFTAATDAFTRANTNCSISESLARLAPVTQSALDLGLRVRGYVSVVIACPYSGRVDPVKVREVAKELIEMGCYEVSLGDTVGMGTPHQISEMLEEVKKDVPVDRLAGHFHDTYGTAIANVFTALSHGVRTIDSAVGGLGGCPYSPGATGNVATEDVVYALKGSKYTVAGSEYGNGTLNLDKLVEIGWWISEKLGRQTTSRAGKALRAKRLREAAINKDGDTRAKL